MVYPLDKGEEGDVNKKLLPPTRTINTKLEKSRRGLLTRRVLINPLTSMRDHNRISPYSVQYNKQTSDEIKKNVNKGIIS